MHPAFMLKDRSNRQLLAEVKNLVGQECNTTAHLIAHLGEIELRGLHLEEGCSSMFKYCTEDLHLSESAAYRRIDVARIASKFPMIFEKLAEGSINLTTVLILGPCLTEKNHRNLLEAARHKSKEEVELLAVAVRPRPDVPSVIRKLPGGASPEGSAPAVLELGGLGAVAGTQIGAAPLSVARTTPQREPLAGLASTPVRPIPSARPVVSPLSPERYKIQFTANAETCRKLKQLQELLRHQIPNGDLATIIDRGLTLLLEQVTREKLDQVKRPRKTASRGRGERVSVGSVDAGVTAGLDAGTQARPPSRHIPADVKRAVWQRDKGRCAFVSKNGLRCSERGRLEFHHVEPYALGGKAITENIALRCRAHNAHEGELAFGTRRKIDPTHVDSVRAASGARWAAGGWRNELALERVSGKKST